MAIQAHLLRTLTRLAANAIKNPKTKSLGEKLFKELAGVRTRNKAITTASEIMKVNPHIPVFKNRLPLNAMTTEKKLFWDMAKLKEMEQVKYPTKNITLRKGIQYNKKKDIASPIYFTGMKKTPMVDIDWQDPFSHALQQVVFRGPIKGARKKAIENLKKYALADRKSRFRAYDTPAGMRIFNLAQRTGPNPMTHAIDKALGGDKYYRRMARNQNIFHSRLSPKPGRTPETGYPEGDFVARAIGDIGFGRANPTNLAEVTKYHDDIIRRILSETEKHGYPTSGGLFSLMKFVGG
jgi:hypothetical protein